MDQERYNRKIELSKAASAQNANKQIDSNNEHESRKTKNEPRRIFPKQHAIADKIKQGQRSEEECEEDASGRAEEKEELSPNSVGRILAAPATTLVASPSSNSTVAVGSATTQDDYFYTTDMKKYKKKKAAAAAPVGDPDSPSLAAAPVPASVDLSMGFTEQQTHAAFRSCDGTGRSSVEENTSDDAATYERKTGQETLVSNEITAAEGNAKGGSHKDKDTAPDPPPNPRSALAQVVGNWAGSVRWFSRPNRNTAPVENMFEILDAEVVQGTSDPPNKRRTIYLGIALVVAVAVIGSAFWFTQSGASQIPPPALRPTLRPTADPTSTRIEQIFCGDSILGDTTTEEKKEVKSCGDVVNETNSPGKKFYFKGDRSFIIMSTCHEYTEGASISNFFDSRIRVFGMNVETNTEECVAGNDDDAGCGLWNKASTAQFQSELNVQYAVYVDGPRTSGGLFELDISCVGAPSVAPTRSPTISKLFYFKGPLKINPSVEYLQMITSPPTDYALHFVIRPLGIVEGWGNIFVFTTARVNGMDYGQRVPIVYFQPGTTILHFSIGTDSFLEEQFLSRSMTLNIDHEVELKVVGSTLTVSVNGVLESSITVGTRSQLSNVEVYIGIGDVANAIISDVSFSSA